MCLCVFVLLFFLQYVFRVEKRVEGFESLRDCVLAASFMLPLHPPNPHTKLSDEVTNLLASVVNQKKGWCSSLFFLSDISI